MEKTKSFTELIVWKKAHEFVLDVYVTTKNFPSSEQFGLTSQFKRAAVSIAANIAEVYRKKTKPEKARFFNISQGSVEECKYYLILSRDLGIPVNTHSFALLEEVSKLLDSYTSKLLKSSDS